MKKKILIIISSVLVLLYTTTTVMQDVQPKSIEEIQQEYSKTERLYWLW